MGRRTENPVSPRDNRECNVSTREDQPEEQEDMSSGRAIRAASSREEEAEEEMPRQAAEMEGAVPREVRSPPKVSKEELERHKLIHVPFRSWCRACVLARARNRMAKRTGEPEDEAGTVRVTTDYFTLEETADHCPTFPYPFGCLL